MPYHLKLKTPSIKECGQYYPDKHQILFMLALHWTIAKLLLKFSVIPNQAFQITFQTFISSASNSFVTGNELKMYSDTAHPRD